MPDNPLDLSDRHRDALREVGNIGAGNAATALSTLLGRRIDMTVPAVSVLALSDVAALLGGDEAVVIGVYFRILGEAPGNMLFVMEEESGRHLVNLLVGPQNGSDHFNNLELSALMEVGNILGSSYLSALVMLTNLNLIISVPALSRDMAQAVLSIGLIQYGQIGDHALLIETAFRDGLDTVKSHFFFIPDPESFNTILSALGVRDE